MALCKACAARRAKLAAMASKVVNKFQRKAHKSGK